MYLDVQCSTLQKLIDIYGSVRKAQHLCCSQTNAEKLLWNRLRNRKFNGLKFRRQVPVDKYVADFVCMEAKLIVEIDGYMHKWKWKKDFIRDAYLEKLGFMVLRFTNKQIEDSANDILKIITKEIDIN